MTPPMRMKYQVKLGQFALRVRCQRKDLSSVSDVVLLSLIHGRCLDFGYGGGDFLPGGLFICYFSIGTSYIVLSFLVMGAERWADI